MLLTFPAADNCACEASLFHVRTIVVSCLVGLGAAGCAVSPERNYAAASVYQRESIQGFTVLFHPQVLDHRRAAEDVRVELERQLKHVSEVVPELALAALRKVRIWVEWNKRRNASEFHPSAAWLEANGYNPEKAGDVEIGNSMNFVDWSRREQPCMVLHELAHAYHFLVLGERHAGIAAAYKQAVESKSYERGAYALVDEKEYFAELTEAYFCRNDFYPFTRAELQTHDPGGYTLLQELWGDL